MIGRPRFFDVDVYLSAVEGMINADEVERAIWMLDNMPAYYRQYPPKRAQEIRESLHRKLWTPIQYKGIYSGEVDFSLWPLRAQKLEALIKGFNEKDQVPHVMELAPGGGWMEAGLNDKGCKFSYESLDLDKGHLRCDQLPQGPNIFVAFEIIEHLSNEWEIYQNYLKFGKEAQVVILSTPLFTYAGGMDDWRNRDLGHLRTYTPFELHAISSKMFQGFDWECSTDDTIVLMGKRK